MSWWGSLTAEFTRDSPYPSLAQVQRSVPTGSEGGPQVREDGATIHVSGNLRDVNDAADSFAVLAWFMGMADMCPSASLTWELDCGPRYRYEYTRAGGLTRLRGVLDL